MKKSLGFFLGAIVIGFASVTAVQADIPPSDIPAMVDCFQDETQLFRACMQEYGGDPEGLFACLANSTICRPTEN